MLCLFSCKAFTHIQRVNQTKFGECAACCIHIGFAEKKKLTCSIAKSVGSCLNHRMLSLRKWRIGNESWLTLIARMMRGVVIQGGQIDMTIDSNNADTIDAPSTLSKALDHQEVHMTIPSTPVHL